VFRGIYPHGRVLWLRFPYKGDEVRESSGVEYHDGLTAQQKAKAWKAAAKRRAKRLHDVASDAEGLKAFVTPKAGRLTVGAMLDLLVTYYKVNRKRSLAHLVSRLAVLRATWGDRPAANLTMEDVETYKAYRMETLSKRGRPVAPATIDRELAAVAQSFRLAIEQKRLTTAPLIKLFRPNNARQGFVNPGDFEAIVAELPDYLQDPARFAYLSAWRVGEVKTLEWRDVDRASGVIILRREHSKNGEPRELPITPGIAAILDRRAADRPNATPWVFHYKGGLPLKNFRKAWQKATAAAGFPGILFHDLRRSGIRNLVNAGVPEKVAMAISGHRTRAAFDRYHIVRRDETTAALLKVEQANQAAPASNVVPIRRAAEGNR
jgi:integrase